MTNSLIGLPPEILCEIVSHFCPHCQDTSLLSGLAQFDPEATWDFDRDLGEPARTWLATNYRSDTLKNARRMRATLAALARTCKTLNALATPYLYHAIGGQEFGCRPCNTHQRLTKRKRYCRPGTPLVTRVIQARPQLAEHVKCIDIPFAGGNLGWCKSGSLDVDSAAAYNLMREFYKTLLQGARLRALDVDVGHYAASVVANMVTVDPSALQNLTALQFGGYNREDDFALHILQVLLRAAPNLRSLYLNPLCSSWSAPRATGTENNARLRELATRWSLPMSWAVPGPCPLEFPHGLTRLAIGASAWSMPDVLSIISRLHSLESFHFSLATRCPDTDKPGFDSDLDVPGDASYRRVSALIHQLLSCIVKHHSATLKSLSVDAIMMLDRGPSLTLRPSETPFYQTGLANCKKLESIALDMGIFQRGHPNLAGSPTFLADILPESTKRVYLWDGSFHRWTLGPQLLALEDAARSGRLPNLRAVEADATTIDPDEILEVLTSWGKHWGNEVEDLMDESGLDDNGGVREGQQIGLATVASLWRRRSPPFEFAFGQGDAGPMYNWD
ncbi:hypothetical protein B0T16DRAFT_463343 [Cercophora newfieldiana]|uniref:Uncharacterized protein n=1 Tax=Cercophora newfieldiana TaxID=92897 RepID=A0AA40CIH9_9PEZI|nr:hypothetical protein B0T16DRAFT_463343 [Cercophora newfieldiana]